MAMNARSIIQQVTETGAHFIIDGDRVGKDRLIPADLMALAREHRDAIRAELETQHIETGKKMLCSAASNLPINHAELLLFFRDDLGAIGAGQVSSEALEANVRWYATHYGKPAIHETDGRVRCCDCQQNRCPYPLQYGRHGSTQPRWCNSYTAKGSA